MKKKLLAIIPIAVAIAYFALYSEDKDTVEFLDIVDYDVALNENSPIFLSATANGNIPETLEPGNEGYGFGWFYEESGKLVGYTTNIHQGSSWHTESVSIEDAKTFCFDDVELAISKVMIDENKIDVVVDKQDTAKLDRAMSYQIIKDDSCKFGFAGIIVDEKRK